MSTIKTGWLKNKNGEKFAPKTLSSQVQTADGTLLEEKINSDLDSLKQEIKNLLLQTGGGNGEGGGGSTIIDVLSLPNDFINNQAIYRLLSAKFIVGKEIENSFICHCVDTLPETGITVTDAEQTSLIAYYSVQNNDVYGYLDSMLSSFLGVDAGWYTLSALAEAFGVEYNGIVNYIDDAQDDGSVRLLLEYDFYVYQNEWNKLIFASENIPSEITWDGEFGDKFALDMSALGFDEGLYFVKVSDTILNPSDVIGGEFEEFYFNDSSSIYEIYEENIDGDQYPGSVVIHDQIISVYDSSALNGALGLPDGYISNGTYFLYITDYIYICRLTLPSKIKKIDKKYLDIDLDSIGGAVSYERYQVLSSYEQSVARDNIDVYSKSEVNNKIGGTIPTTTTSDNGKFLRVVSGKPAWVSISYAEEATF